ncbi:MAG: hypothetical protein WD267_04340 [Balneolales bacterium]
MGGDPEAWDWGAGRWAWSAERARSREEILGHGIWALRGRGLGGDPEAWEWGAGR